MPSALGLWAYIYVTTYTKILMVKVSKLFRKWPLQKYGDYGLVLDAIFQTHNRFQNAPVHKAVVIHKSLAIILVIAIVYIN